MKNLTIKRSSHSFIILLLSGISIFNVQTFGQVRLYTNRADYVLSPAVQTYFQTVGSYSTSASGSGAFQNEIINQNVATKIQLGFGYTKHVDLYFYEHDYGVSLDWIFHADGPIKYRFNIPFTANIDLPRSVYPGQRVYFAPSYDIASNATMQGEQNYSFYHESTAWMDAPFDGLDDLNLNFTQYPDKAHLYVKFPVFPLVPSFPVDFDITFPPFNSGGGSYDGGSIKLAGTGTLINPTPIVSGLDRNELILGGSVVSQPAWSMSIEHFELCATILKAIPYTAPAGYALDFVREAGGFKLSTSVDGSIWRQDALWLEISDLPSMLVPNNLIVGSTWNFTDYPVTVKYRVHTISFFAYRMGYSVIFDMRTISPKTLVQQPMADHYVDDGGVATDWVELETVFKISGSLPVVSKQRMFSERRPLVIDGGLALSNTYQQPSVIQKNPKNVPGIIIPPRIVNKRIISETERVTPPTATSNRGLPRTNEYAVILGNTTRANATIVVDSLRHFGINAFQIRVQNTDVISLGNFATENDANTMKNIIKEVFKVEPVVTHRVKNVPPLQSTTITKLQAPIQNTRRVIK